MWNNLVCIFTNNDSEMSSTTFCKQLKFLIVYFLHGLVAFSLRSQTLNEQMSD